METEMIAIIALLALMFLASAYAYPMLPPSVASHWDAYGNVNGYMPALVGAFFVPALSLALVLFFLAIPYIDPLRANIERFRAEYLRFVLVMLLFLSLVHAQSLLWNLGTVISFSVTMPVMLGCLFIYVGHLLGKSKRNWFIGIRTPWTMSSDEVWDRTHRLGRSLFMAVGVVSIVSVLLPVNAFLLVIPLVIAAAIALVVYSYLEYRKLAKGEENAKKGKSRKP